MSVFYLQSEYSLLNNLIKLEKLVETCKNENYDFVALTDKNNLHGLYKFFMLAKEHQIKAIYGMKVSVDLGMEESGFLLYIKNQTGYLNLLAISKIIQTENRNITINELIDLQEGLIIISSGQDSVLDRNLFNNNIEEGLRNLRFFKKSFKQFYVGLSLSNYEYEIKVIPALVSMSIEEGVTLLPLQRTAYLNKGDELYFQTLVKIGNSEDPILNEGDLSFKGLDELKYRFSDYSFVLDNAKKLADSINYELKFPLFEMPYYQSSNLDKNEYLKDLSLRGLKRRIKINNLKDEKNYYDRLKYELAVIERLDFSDYFLIVQDFVNYAKKEGITVGPGRGSAASSLVAYSIGITEIDPIKYNLLFERFLNPERKTMPDIDMDFPDNKRDQVINYCYNKYKKEHIAAIVTFDRFAFKSSIRDVARTLNLTTSQQNILVDSINGGYADEEDPNIQIILKTSEKIVGLPRHTGTHAAGIILTQNDLTKTIPLQSDTEKFYKTQWEQSDLEQLGLMKIDFLGIKNLAIIAETINLVKKTNPNFDLNKIAFDNSKTYELLRKADTNGIFQLESAGMQNVLKKLQPENFEDLIALLALYRPGPMDNIDLYIQRKKGQNYENLHPELANILKPTYGIIVYQEQIMQIANKFAGYSLAEADILRRGISKKDLQILKNEEKHFIESCLKQGHSEEVAKNIYEYIVRFADYGFNRAHSVSYATISYQMAYLKANYYQEFVIILLSNMMSNDKLTERYLKELIQNGYKLLPSDINMAKEYYQITDKGIVLPFNLVKGIGVETSKKLILEREENGLFKNFMDFLIRTNKILSNANIENLISVNALDSFGLNHATLLLNLNQGDSTYGAFFEDVIFEEAKEELTIEEKIIAERKALNYNIFYNYYEVLKPLRTKTKTVDLKTALKQSRSRLLVMVVNLKEIRTKNNNKMAFITITDGKQELDVTLFSNEYESFLKLPKSLLYILEIEENIYREKKTYVVKKIQVYQESLR